MVSSWFVPAHCTALQSIDDLTKVHFDALSSIETAIIQIVAQPKTTSQIIKEISNLFGLEIKNVAQYHLLCTAVNAALTYLMEIGKINWRIQENSLIWETEAKTLK
ncbi:MAG: hypothetical protein AABX38_06230 [Candidatus Micrarchaeota archaeon]